MKLVSITRVMLAGFVSVIDRERRGSGNKGSLADLCRVLNQVSIVCVSGGYLVDEERLEIAVED